MKNSNEESLEKKTISINDLNSESISDKTEEEIIFNNCNNELEEEYLDTEQRVANENQNINKAPNNNIPQSNPKNRINLKANATTSIQSEANKSTKNKFHSYYSPKFDFARKKRKKHEELKTADDLFVQALQKNKTELLTNKEFDPKGNTMSTKISDLIYDKYVGNNEPIINTNGMIKKMKEEEFNLNKELKRSKNDSKKINEMINRQENFTKYKQRRLNEKEKEINEKINQECIFMPNGKNTVSTTRSPKDFYDYQIQFLAKKENSINYLQKSLIEKENKNKNVVLTSKASEKIAASKNPNESKEQLYERLHFEKLKNIKEKIEKPKEEKKISKKEAKNLVDKLYKERIVFKENKIKKREKENYQKDLNRGYNISDNSNRVLLSKFLKYYDKKLLEIFNRKDNFQINFDEYKLILINMGCVNPNLQSDEALIKESFFNYLNPKNNKIDTYTLLLFCLAALGIYKGNDEPKTFQSIEANKSNKTKEKEGSGLKRLSHRRSQKPKVKTINELIKFSVSDIDLNKQGFPNKIAKNINKKFYTFATGINESWTEDISKKKQERRERSQNSIGKRPKASSKSKSKDYSTNYLKRNENSKNNNINLTNMYPINNSYKKNNNLKNLKNNDSNNNKNKTISAQYNSNKFDDFYKRLQFKKNSKDYKALKKQFEKEEMALCTFQPNVGRFSKSHSKDKNRHKLNKKQIDYNFEKLYQDGKASYLHKKSLIDPDLDDNLDNQINCTFKPEIHKFNNEVFINNPIKEELQKFEKIGDQKMSVLGNKEYKKPMNFVIEQKLNKEDIFDRVIPERFSHKNNENERDNETALLKVEVNLDENNNTDKIILYPGDDVMEKTLQFCNKHRLSEEKKNTLINIIMEKIEETKNGENLMINKQNKIFQDNYVSNNIKDENKNQIIEIEEENNENKN